ncbi:MAG: hypothetical protein OEN23_04935 [Paracoccaceae bacterium]|nr:hypothetical protein [Paracoccaceae bacterium]
MREEEWSLFRALQIDDEAAGDFGPPFQFPKEPESTTSKKIKYDGFGSPTRHLTNLLG